MSDMTSAQKKQRVEALLEERRGYEIHGKTDRVKAVDEQLKAYGHEAKTPRERAEKRTPRTR